MTIFTFYRYLLLFHDINDKSNSVEIAEIIWVEQNTRAQRI